MATFEEKIKEINDDMFGGNMSTRDQIIADRATERAEILTLVNLLDFDSKNTTETWRIHIRNILTGKVDDYYKKYTD